MQTVSDYWDRGIQFAVVANGPHEVHFRKIIEDFGLGKRVAIVYFDERLSRLGYAGSDFMLLPSLFEPCGLPQMTAPLYGTLPVVHGTGGLYDTIRPMDVDKETGNGFRFDNYDPGALRWGIDRAMDFHALPTGTKDPQIRRVMKGKRQGIQPRGGGAALHRDLRADIRASAGGVGSGRVDQRIQGIGSIHPARFVTLPRRTRSAGFPGAEHAFLLQVHEKDAANFGGGIRMVRHGMVRGDDEFRFHGRDV